MPFLAGVVRPAKPEVCEGVRKPKSPGQTWSNYCARSLVTVVGWWTKWYLITANCESHPLHCTTMHYTSATVSMTKRIKLLILLV